MNSYELAKAQQAYSAPTLEEIIEWQADRIAELEKDLALKTRDRDVFANFTLAYEKRIAELSDGCGNCHACLVGVMENHMPVTSQRMIVCSDCGNKRCPKASNHRHQCTGSNEVGQYGSIYTAPRELSDEEIRVFMAEMPHLTERKDLLMFARAILKKASEK